MMVSNPFKGGFSMTVPLSGHLTHTRLRTPEDTCLCSGMCAACSQDCTGTCEVGLSALRGSEAAYPYDTASTQFASRKDYPVDLSHFNINGRVFGAQGIPADPETATPGRVDLSCRVGTIPCRAPILLPAMAKLNWRDYFAGAAMAGVPVVIGENAIKNDPALEHDRRGKVCHAPLLREMTDHFRRLEDGHGDIIFQANPDDVALDTAIYALTHSGIRSVEIKFGQAAKGIQHVAPAGYEEALWLKEKGYLVEPDPTAQETRVRMAAGEPVRFFQYGRLPMFDEDSISRLITRLREAGAENILFKMAGYDPRDVKRVLEMASDNRVDLVTLDGAGGGTGHSPLKMMDEWGRPTVELEAMGLRELEQLKKQGRFLPPLCMAGGLTTEDMIFKTLALGSPHVTLAGVGRGAMAAAMAGDRLGKLLEEGTLPTQYRRFGSAREELFRDWELLAWRYRDRKELLTPGGVGVYSYLDRLSFGLKLLMTLNRKFDLSLLGREDLIPLTRQAKECLAGLEE